MIRVKSRARNKLGRLGHKTLRGGKKLFSLRNKYAADRWADNRSTNILPKQGADCAYDEPQVDRRSSQHVDPRLNQPAL
jgi:hypothetical protein